MSVERDQIEAPVAAFTARFITANLYRVPAWSPRRAGTIRLAQAAQAHIWALQESEEYERAILPSLDGDWLEASDRSNISIAYRSDLFKRLWHGEYSVSADRRNRYHVMALLQHLETKVRCLVVNVHMSNGSAWKDVRTKHARAIVDDIEAQKRAKRIDDSTPVIVMGDINDTRKASDPGSPAGVFAAAGLTDITTNKARIDRVFGRNVVLSGEVVIIKTVRTFGEPDPSDHNWTQVDLNVGVGTPAPPVEIPPPPVELPPEPPPVSLTPLEVLEAEHGRIATFYASIFERARVERHPLGSRYVAWVQGALMLPVTCVWSDDDQAVLDAWRHVQFPEWSEADYRGPVSTTSMTRLYQVAKAAGQWVPRGGVKK